jgi:hypothetical protein
VLEKMAVKQGTCVFFFFFFFWEPLGNEFAHHLACVSASCKGPDEIAARQKRQTFLFMSVHLTIVLHSSIYHSPFCKFICLERCRHVCHRSRRTCHIWRNATRHSPGAKAIVMPSPTPHGLIQIATCTKWRAPQGSCSSTDTFRAATK